MQISSRFTIATHMLIILALEGKKQKLTSDILSESILLLSARLCPSLRMLA